MTEEFAPFVLIEYSDELKQLPGTYKSAMELDVSEFAAWLRQSADRPLLAIGAGGSLPIAQMAALLHHRATGQLSRAGEPMDIFLGSENSTNTAGLLVTASGSHSDSLAACASLSSQEEGWAVFCGKTQSAGADLLEGSATPVFSYDLLPELHGWVAVNALLGQAVVLAKAYSEAFPSVLGTLPDTLEELLPRDAVTVEGALSSLTSDLRAVFERETLVFLHGPDTRAAALDLDSKFAEAGLGHLVVSEYRNFAHGRYQMMLPIQDSCGVLTFSTRREEGIASATLDAIPDHIPHVGIEIAASGIAAEQVASLLALLIAVGALGEVRSVSPGWGSRNTFGDVLYELDLGRIFGVSV